jgi:hypothetical protein
MELAPTRPDINCKPRTHAPRSPCPFVSQPDCAALADEDPFLPCAEPLCYDFYRLLPVISAPANTSEPGNATAALMPPILGALLANASLPERPAPDASLPLLPPSPSLPAVAPVAPPALVGANYSGPQLLVPSAPGDNPTRPPAVNGSDGARGALAAPMVRRRTGQSGGQAGRAQLAGGRAQGAGQAMTALLARTSLARNSQQQAPIAQGRRLQEAPSREALAPEPAQRTAARMKAGQQAPAARLIRQQQLMGAANALQQLEGGASPSLVQFTPSQQQSAAQQAPTGQPTAQQLQAQQLLSLERAEAAQQAEILQQAAAGQQELPVSSLTLGSGAGGGGQGRPQPPPRRNPSVQCLQVSGRWAPCNVLVHGGDEVGCTLSKRQPLAISNRVS